MERGFDLPSSPHLLHDDPDMKNRLVKRFAERIFEASATGIVVLATDAC
jgi:hypothetical protein